MPNILYQTNDRIILEKVAADLKAIAHPIRLAILDLLKKSNRLSVTEIYQGLRLEQAVVSQHLGVLKDRDLVTCDREGKHSFYSLSDQCMVEVLDLLIGQDEPNEAAA